MSDYQKRSLGKIEEELEKVKKIEEEFEKVKKNEEEREEVKNFSLMQYIPAPFRFCFGGDWWA